MSKYNKNHNITSCENIQHSSKLTDTAVSDSSIKNVMLNDNGLLTNKKIFIYYGKEKRDSRLEFVLKRLNAMILEFYDDSINYVIAAVNRKRKSDVSLPNQNNTTTLSKSTVMGSRALKLIGLAKQKITAAVNQTSIPDNDSIFFDQVTEKGIQILYKNNVWSWLRKYHALILQEDEDTFDSNDNDNTTRDSNGDVRKLPSPAIKIIDVNGQIRPIVHQKCSFQQQMFEESCQYEESAKAEPEPLKPFKLDKGIQRKSTKTHKQTPKSENGFCECCDMNYKNLLNHLRSADHRSYAGNDRNFEGIEQTISAISDLTAFLKIRLRKQSILDKRKTNRKMIKSLSANDFKIEKESLLKTKSEVNQCFEEAVSFKESLCCEMLAEQTQQESVQSHEDINVMQQLCYASMNCVEMNEEIDGAIPEIESCVRPTISVQKCVLQMVNVSRNIFRCNTQQLQIPEVVELINIDIDRLLIHNNHGEGVASSNCITIVESELKTADINIQSVNDCVNDSSEFEVTHERPRSQRNADSTPDSIIDLKMYTNNKTIHFNALTKVSLTKPNQSIAVDKLVTHRFKNIFQIELPKLKMVSEKPLCEVTNQKPILKPVTAKRKKKSVNREVGRKSLTVHSVDYRSPSIDDGTLQRRAKSLARDNISLTTQMYLN